MTERQKIRVAIVSDEDGNWYVRRISLVEHDLITDEKVYRCNQPIGAKYRTPEEALYVAKQYMGIT